MDDLARAVLGVVLRARQVCLHRPGRAGIGDALGDDVRVRLHHDRSRRVVGRDGRERYGRRCGAAQDLRGALDEHAAVAMGVGVFVIELDDALIEVLVHGFPPLKRARLYSTFLTAWFVLHCKMQIKEPFMSCLPSRFDCFDIFDIWSQKTQWNQGALINYQSENNQRGRGRPSPSRDWICTFGVASFRTVPRENAHA